MEKLQLGVAREVITPTLGGQLYGYRPDIVSEAVEDDLTVTAYYFKQGDTQALMISATVCELQGELITEVRRRFEEQLGIPAANCMICATHTHSGPNTAGFEGWGDIDREYCDTVFVPALLSVAKQAQRNARSVKMAVATGDSLVGVNRRELMADGTVDFGQDPSGSFNPQMAIVSFADENGTVVGNLVHYGCHGTAAGANREITRDWSGIMIDAVERQSGGMTAFFNGCEGDVGPRISNGKTVGDLSYVHELGDIAARDATGIFSTITDYSDVSLAVSNKTVHIPLKPRMSAAEAAEKLEQYKAETINVGGKIRGHLEEVLESYKTPFEEHASLDIEQIAVSIGDVVFFSSPYELFSEIGMRINAAFDDKLVLALTNTNDFGGYFVTEKEVGRGGYEVDVFQNEHIQEFCENADTYMAAETVGHVRELLSKR